MRILVTGSSGFIGRYLVETLRKKKHTIIEFSRDEGDDITSSESVAKKMKNVEVVIHLAAELDEAKGWEKLHAVNVQGTHNVLEAAEKAKVEQFIFISSVGVYGHTVQRRDETSELEPETLYEKSKLEAEKAVQEFQEVFPVTVIRPALVLGPTPYWAQVFKLVRKGFPLIGKGKNAWQMVYVKDLVEFILHCVGNEDAFNETFVCAEKEAHTLREIINMVAEIQGKKHVRSVPASIGTIASYFFLAHGKITGKKPLLSPAHVKRLSKHREYSIEKAEKLGWKPAYSTKAALEETYSELQKNKMI